MGNFDMYSFYWTDQ